MWYNLLIIKYCYTEDKMDKKMLEAVTHRQGFIAALDQSGGSTAKTLEKYGIPKDQYSSEDEMFELIHEMRKRVFTSKEFTRRKDFRCNTIL